jgi:hypothetical protein
MLGVVSRGEGRSALMLDVANNIFNIVDSFDVADM